jgi:V/A-type H+-transporting ATPase subunit I
MIVPMKKIFLVTETHDVKESLLALRKLGILHVEHLNVPGGDKLSAINDELALINQAVILLTAPDKKQAAIKNKDIASNWPALAKHIVDLHKRFAQLREFSVTLAQRIDECKAWGDFDPQDIYQLRLSGIDMRLYKLSDDQIKQIPGNIYLKKISKHGNIYYCVAIIEKGFEVLFKEVELPKDSLARMQARLIEDAKTIALLKEEILKYNIYFQALMDIRSQKLRELEFYEALGGMEQEESLKYIKGYIPFDAQGNIEKSATLQGWGVLVTDPDEEDNVPTLVRNPKWISLIKPVFKLLEIIPGYRELDISPLFLIFFSLFFGMLIGDAGYGFIYLCLTFLVHKKMGNKVKDKGVFFLFYVLSSCAIIWGVLIGAFFGQAWLLKAGYKPLAPSLNDVNFIQAFCFLIGAIHLSIAHSWRAILKSPSLSALSDIGWILVLWVAFFTAKTLLLGDTFPGFGKWLLSVGLILVLFFTNPQRNILKAVGEGLGTIALSLINNFTDIVSYVRLFAVGLAGVAIADAFNSMASDMATGGFLTLIMSGVILIAGHGLNIILGPMSVLVHGVRLNVLEFSGHANVTWSGFQYKPLKED